MGPPSVPVNASYNDKSPLKHHYDMVYPYQSHLDTDLYGSLKPLPALGPQPLGAMDGVLGEFSPFGAYYSFVTNCKT